MRRHAVLVGGPTLLAAAAALVLSLGVLDAQQASGSVRLPVSQQMEHELIISAHMWLAREGVNVSVGSISIVTGQRERAVQGPLAAFVAQDHRFYGSACLAVHGRFPIPAVRPGDLIPTRFSRWPLCVLFSKTSPSATWDVRYTAGSSCGNIGAVLRGLWGPSIPVCRLQPQIYQL